MADDTTLERFAAAASLLPPVGSPVVIAVSGGADSMALWDLLAVDGRWPLIVYHLDHGLRLDAGSDADLIRQRAAAYGADGRGPIHVIFERAMVADLAKHWRCGIEAAGRRQRYDRLLAVAQHHQAAVVATAHHRDDQAETVLANLLRGAGPIGRGGMPPRRSLGPGVTLVRPLLGLGRDDLRRHLVVRGVRWCEDTTNLDPRFTRNHLRHSVLPCLERVAPGFAEALAAEAERIRVNTAADQAAAEVLCQTIANDHLGLAPVLAASDSVRQLVWRGLLRRLGLPHDRRHLRQLDALVRGPAGRRLALGEILLLRRSDALAWEVARPISDDAEVVIPAYGLWVRGRESITCIASHLPVDPRCQAFEAFLDRDAVGWPLTWRLAMPGERWWPLGAPGNTTVVRYLAHKGVPSRLRPLLPVIADPNGIVWLPGFTIADRAKVSPTTREVVHLVYDRLPVQAEEIIE